MGYLEKTVDSKFRIKRWSHRTRFENAINLADLHNNQRVADYGAGNGYLLLKAYQKKPVIEAWAFEPVIADQARDLLGNGAKIVESADELPSAYFDKVFCMEVLEHLRPALRDEALQHIRRILKPAGTAIITVPVEIGLSSLFKNTFRAAIGKSHRGIKITDVAWTVIGMPRWVKRKELHPNYISSHVGFDYRTLPSEFERHGFVIEQREFSPVKAVGPVVNSQVSYRLRLDG